MRLVETRMGPALHDGILNGMRLAYKPEDHELVGEAVKLVESRWGIKFRAGQGNTLVVQPHGVEIPFPKRAFTFASGVIVSLETQVDGVWKFYAACLSCTEENGKLYSRRREPALYRWANQHRCRR